jgi:hypothetical protein
MVALPDEDDMVSRKAPPKLNCDVKIWEHLREIAMVITERPALRPLPSAHSRYRKVSVLGGLSETRG